MRDPKIVCGFLFGCCVLRKQGGPGMDDRLFILVAVLPIE